MNLQEVTSQNIGRYANIIEIKILLLVPEPAFFEVAQVLPY